MTLASAIAAAERRLRAVEGMVEELLTTMFPATATYAGWRGWKFINGVNNRFGIEVFSVDDNPMAVRSLFGAGFTTAVLHGHSAARFLSCACKVHEAY